jgi:ABC-type multidrug transport system fused ATPase/permease subunit
MSIRLRLIMFARPYIPQVLFTWLTVAGAAAFIMLTPQVLRWGIDTGIKPPNAVATGARLAETITPSDTSFSITDGERIQGLERIQVGREDMRIVTVVGNQVQVDRGFDETRATTHLEGDLVKRPERLAYEGSTATLFLVAAALLGLAVFRSIFAYFQQYMSEWLAQHVAYDLRNAIYEKLQRLSYAYHDKQQTGQLMSRATQDVEAARMFISMGVIRLVDMAIRIGVAAILMFLLDWRLAIIAWLLLPLVGVRSIQIQLRLREIWYQVQEQLGRTTTVLQENLTGVRVVRAFSREDEEIEKFEKEATELFTWNYASNRIQAVNTPFYAFMAMLSQVMVLWAGATWISGGSFLGMTNDTLSAGDLVAFLFYLQLLLMPLRMLGFVVSQFARAGAAGERIFEVLDAESAVREKPDAIVLDQIKGHVRFDNVAFAYDAISPVLRDITIDAPPGKILALLGPTGSGKTTIVNLMPRFYDASGGKITIDGIDIRDVTLQSLRRNIGIIQQDVFLFSATIRENIAYGAVDATYEQIIEAAKIARIHDFIMSLPDGYDTWVGERGITLSGGQKQRVSIARTLLLDPRILILDDSTSSVDTQTEYLIQQALGAVMQGRTTFVIAQRLRTVKNADQILVLKDGFIVERGTHDDLIAQDGLYRDIYDLELRDQEEALARMQAIAQGEQAAPEA